MFPVVNSAFTGGEGYQFWLPQSVPIFLYIFWRFFFLWKFMNRFKNTFPKKRNYEIFTTDEIIRFLDFWSWRISIYLPGFFIFLFNQKSSHFPWFSETLNLKSKEKSTYACFLWSPLYDFHWLISLTTLFFDSAFSNPFFCKKIFKKKSCGNFSFH